MTDDNNNRNTLRTFQPGRRQVNILTSRKREHSRKPDELYNIIEQCSPGPYLELFARRLRKDWKQWGNEVPDEDYVRPSYKKEEFVQASYMPHITSTYAARGRS